MKKKICRVFAAVLILALLPAATAEAKNNKLSVTNKTLVVGQKFTIRLKKADKVKWKSGNAKVVKVKKKSGGQAVLCGKSKGKATVTAVYRGKKYRCKVTVKPKDSKAKQGNAKTDSNTDNPALNAAEVSLYYRSGKYDDILPVDSSHSNSFRFRLSGTKKEVRKWELAGEDKDYFEITQYGQVSMSCGKIYGEPDASVMVKATLTDGKAVTATVIGYNETNLYLDTLFRRFAQENITSGMTEKEKADCVAEYIGEISDYAYYNSDWQDIFLRGRGDCMASRYALEALCRYIGVEAQGCGSLKEHGKTVVKADGNYYIYITGYNEPRPRSYMVSETTEEYLKEHAGEMEIWMGYFER